MRSNMLWKNKCSLPWKKTAVTSPYSLQASSHRHNYINQQATQQKIHGPVSWKSSLGLKPCFKIWRIRKPVLAQKPLLFVFEADGFIALFSKLLKSSSWMRTEQPCGLIKLLRLSRNGPLDQRPYLNNYTRTPSVIQPKSSNHKLGLMLGCGGGGEGLCSFSDDSFDPKILLSDPIVNYWCFSCNLIWLLWFHQLYCNNHENLLRG